MAVIVVAGATIVGTLVAIVILVAGDADREVQFGFGAGADLIGLERPLGPHFEDSLDLQLVN